MALTHPPHPAGQPALPLSPGGGGPLLNFASSLNGRHWIAGHGPYVFEAMARDVLVTTIASEGTRQEQRTMWRTCVRWRTGPKTGEVVPGTTRTVWEFADALDGLEAQAALDWCQAIEAGTEGGAHV